MDNEYVLPVNSSYDVEFGRGRKLTIANGALESIPIDPAVGKLEYWARRLCDVLEKPDIDAELVQRCIEAIRENS